MAYFIDRVEAGRVRVSSHDGATLRIGRGTNVEIRLEDPAVELIHAVIEPGEGGYVVHDQGSVLGTLVNGERVTSRALRSGDCLEIGTFEVTVEVLPGERPLFVHVCRIGEEDPGPGASVATMRADSAQILKTFADTLMLRTGTLRTTGGRSLEEMAEVYAKARGLPTEESGTSVLDEVMKRPPPEAPKPAVAERAEVAPVDYAAAYRLERGAWLRKATWTVVLALAALFGLAFLVSANALEIFSPGDLQGAHKSVTANRCGACHRPFRGVPDDGCLAAGCHAAVGAHQTSQIRDPSCLECHREHSTLQALRQLDETGGCVACHARLGAETAGPPRFVATITDFTPEKHPPFTPRSDPGNLRFTHAWHLNKLKVRGEPSLQCESCHRLDAEGELEPVSFDKHCRRCHNLAFDVRFGAQEAEHDTPAKMLFHMTGFYLQNRRVLRQLTYQEEDRLRGRTLSEEDRLAVVAEWNALSLVRNKCRVCHRFDTEPGRRPVKDLHVEPTQLRTGWYDHATFRHGPHLGVRMTCDSCHLEARSSKDASDVLLPVIHGCFGCHREPEPGENVEGSPLGRRICIACHTYHPEPQEVAARGGGENAAP